MLALVVALAEEGRCLLYFDVCLLDRIDYRGTSAARARYCTGTNPLRDCLLQASEKLFGVHLRKKMADNCQF